MCISHIFDKIPVYTRDSVKLPGDDRKKQSVIDEWTDLLACRMADKVRMVTDDNGDVEFERIDRRGGHNRQTIEMLNADGEVARVFTSMEEAGEYFGVNHRTIQYYVDGRKPVIPSYTLRRRETNMEKKKRLKAAQKAFNKRLKTIKKKLKGLKHGQKKKKDNRPDASERL
jgi:hypothetical protein